MHVGSLTTLENEVKVASLGGIEAIVSAMTRHSGHEGIQQQGCAALVNLAFHSGLLLRLYT